MRAKRLKAGRDRSAVYHVISRTVNGQFLFDAAERETLRRLIWKVAEFSGVEVLTYCVLSNHFHLLVRVPSQCDVDDKELLRRCAVLPPRDFAGRNQPGVDLLPAVKEALQAGGPRGEAMRQALHRRMHDLSEFVKTLKQRFTIWFNHTHQRFGTLWSERFKSMLVEDDPQVLATVAAYIDLNPVRAGLVDDPKDYRWCGYGEAMGQGTRQVREGLRSALGCSDWSSTQREYRMLLFGIGSAPKSDGSAAAEITPEAAREVLAAGGRLPTATVLRCRVRYFIDGAALGSRAFVSEVLRAYQAATGRRTRQSSPHTLAGCSAWDGLATMRGLRRGVWG